MKYCITVAVCVFVFTTVAAEPVKTVSDNERCPVCGMFVAKYPNWLAQIQLADGETAMFDGVKDMMAYFFEPRKYGAKSTVEDVYVKDYYSQQWVDGKKALYVLGSDVMGPMGHELIPLASMKAAKSFLEDHKGKKIYNFNEIDRALIDALRSGGMGGSMQTMKHSNN
ncbi:MAG: nitrous oxide reductase accessory protein NosL [Desulfopila sp.]